MNIRKAREKLGLSRNKLAKLVTEEFTDLSERTIESWEYKENQICHPRWYEYFLKKLLARM